MQNANAPWDRRFKLLSRVAHLSLNRNPPTDFGSSDRGETIYICVREPSGPIGGVLWYYAALAYPKRDERQKRRKFVEAMMAMRFKEFAVQFGSRKKIPRYFSRFKREKMLGGMNLGSKRIERRIRAGVMGWCICLNEKSYPYSAPTPDGKLGVVLHGPNTVKAVIRAYVESRHAGPNPVFVALESALANAAHRIWAESLPVLHIAMANPITIKIVEAQANNAPLDDGQVARDLFDSIHKPVWLRNSLEDAEVLRLNLRQRLGHGPDDPQRSGFKAESAIRLLPTEDPSQASYPPK